MSKLAEMQARYQKEIVEYNTAYKEAVAKVADSMQADSKRLNDLRNEINELTKAAQSKHRYFCAAMEEAPISKRDYLEVAPELNGKGTVQISLVREERRVGLSLAEDDVHRLIIQLQGLYGQMK